MPKKVDAASVKTAKKTVAASNKTKVVKTVTAAARRGRPAKKMSEAKIEALLEQRKSTTTIPLFEYEYNLRLGLMFGVLIGVILTTYLWVLVNFIYF